jgi:hypothetical protein
MNIKDARKLEDGSLAFPKRGEAPTHIAGYMRDPGDSFLFKPIMKKCKFRTFKEDTADCCSGAARLNMYCNLFVKNITWNNCNSCDKNEE